MLQHGAFCAKGLKEKHYFSDEKAFLTQYEAHYDAYVKQFEGCNRTQLTLDATPSYVWYDYAPELLQRSYTRKELAKKKFILLLREPVQRSYSEYQRDLRICLRAYDSASSGYDFEHINKKRTAEEQSAHAQKYCAKMMHVDPAAEVGMRPTPLPRLCHASAPPLPRLCPASAPPLPHLCPASATNAPDAPPTHSHFTFHTHTRAQGDDGMDQSLLTFAGWVASPAGATELTRGYFLEQLQRWLGVVPRRQVRAPGWRADEAQAGIHNPHP